MLVLYNSIPQLRWMWTLSAGPGLSALARERSWPGLGSRPILESQLPVNSAIVAGPLHSRQSKGAGGGRDPCYFLHSNPSSPFVSNP